MGLQALQVILRAVSFFAKFAAELLRVLPLSRLDMSSKKKRMYDNNGPGIFSNFIGVLVEKNIAANPTSGKMLIQCVGEEMASRINPEKMEEEESSATSNN